MNARKPISVILALCIVFCAITVTPITAFADRSETDGGSGKYFRGHTVTIGRDITVGFYIELSDLNERDDASVLFTWANNSRIVRNTEIVLSGLNGLWWVDCPVSIAELPNYVTAVLYISGVEVDRDRYSFVEYANDVLTNTLLQEEYLERHYSLSAPEEKRQAELNKLFTLFYTLLDLGTCVQYIYGVNTDRPANGGNALLDSRMSVDSIPSTASDMSEGLDEFGIEYLYSKPVLLPHTHRVRLRTAHPSGAGDRHAFH